MNGDRPNGRDIASAPQVGDVAFRRDKPTREVTVRFTDAIGQECLWYTEERFMTVVAWRRWYRRSGATDK